VPIGYELYPVFENLVGKELSKSQDDLDLKYEAQKVEKEVVDLQEWADDVLPKWKIELQKWKDILNGEEQEEADPDKAV
jgi:hypothetical protein